MNERELAGSFRDTIGKLKSTRQGRRLIAALGLTEAFDEFEVECELIANGIIVPTSRRPIVYVANMPDFEVTYGLPFKPAN